MPTTLEDALWLLEQYKETEGETTVEFLAKKEEEVRSAFTASRNYVPTDSPRDKEIKAITAELHRHSVLATLSKFAGRRDPAEPEDNIILNIETMRERLRLSKPDQATAAFFEVEFVNYARRAMKANGATDDETDELLRLKPSRNYGGEETIDANPPGTQP